MWREWDRNVGVVLKYFLVLIFFGSVFKYIYLFWFSYGKIFIKIKVIFLVIGVYLRFFMKVKCDMYIDERYWLCFFEVWVFLLVEVGRDVLSCLFFLFKEKKFNNNRLCYIFLLE